MFFWLECILYLIIDLFVAPICCGCYRLCWWFLMQTSLEQDEVTHSAGEPYRGTVRLPKIGWF